MLSAPRFELVQFVREVGENTHCVFEPYEPKGARHAARHGGNYNLVGTAKINNDPFGSFFILLSAHRFELVQFVREVGENTQCVFEPYEPKGARHAARHGGNYNLVGAARNSNRPFGSVFILPSAPGGNPV